MKQSILLLLIAIWFAPPANGQQLTIKRNAHGEHTVEYSSGHLRPDRAPFCLSQETKVGIGISGGGILIGCAGIGLYNTYYGRTDYKNNQQSVQMSVGIWLVGGVLGILGSAFAIDGSIRDYHRYCRQEYFSVISNNPNEVGFAFNFK